MAALILGIHLAWILWVIFGALVTRGRPVLSWIHIASLVWGVIVETSPLPCPLTTLEQYFEGRTYASGCLAHYLDRIVYPDLPGWVLTAAGVGVCVVNLAVYSVRIARRRRRP
jgi:hypothetical protein